MKTVSKLVRLLVIIFIVQGMYDVFAKKIKPTNIQTTLTILNMKNSCKKYFKELYSTMKHANWKLKNAQNKKEWISFIDKMKIVFDICKKNDSDLNSWLLRKG